MKKEQAKTVTDNKPTKTKEELAQIRKDMMKKKTTTSTTDLHAEQ